MSELLSLRLQCEQFKIPSKNCTEGGSQAGPFRLKPLPLLSNKLSRHRNKRLSGLSPTLAINSRVARYAPIIMCWPLSSVSPPSCTDLARPPNSDLASTRVTLAPRLVASTAADKPAQPAPIMRIFFKIDPKLELSKLTKIS